MNPSLDDKILAGEMARQNAFRGAVPQSLDSANAQYHSKINQIASEIKQGAPQNVASDMLAASNDVTPGALPTQSLNDTLGPVGL